MNQITTEPRHGNLRRIAQDGIRHGANAYRPNRDCAEMLEAVLSMQRPFFIREPHPVDVRVYRLAFETGWRTARELSR